MLPFIYLFLSPRDKSTRHKARGERIGIIFTVAGGKTRSFKHMVVEPEDQSTKRQNILSEHIILQHSSGKESVAVCKAKKRNHCI